MTTWSASLAVNHHKAQFRPGRLRQALHCLAFLLLLGLGPEATAAKFRQREWSAPESAPYLTATGPPVLRFREPEVPPEPALRPVAVGPPVPGLNAVESAVAVANAAAVRVSPAGGVPVMDVAKPGQLNTPQGAPKPLAAAKPIPPAILPDDTRPQVRAEDFLPYFQIPGGPVPAQLPPSSATYTQTPR